MNPEQGDGSLIFHEKICIMFQSDAIKEKDADSLSVLTTFSISDILYNCMSYDVKYLLNVKFI